MHDHEFDSGSTGPPAFTFENKSNIHTEQVRSVLRRIAEGLDMAHVHVIVKNRRRSPGSWLIDEDVFLTPTRQRGSSLGWSGYYLDIERFKEERPHADLQRWRDKPPTNARALVVLRVGQDGSDDVRMEWLVQVARHEFTHHYQTLQERCTKTRGKYLRDPIEIEARAAEVGQLPWQV